MSLISGVNVTQTSTNTAALVVGSTLNAWQGLSVAYTIVNAGNDTISWIVYGANSSDLTDKVIVQASADIAKDASGSYSAFVAPYGFYCVYIVSKVNGAPGTVTVRGNVKG
jgi:hypothetical protein